MLKGYNNGDYNRNDWTILSFIKDGIIIDENSEEFKKWLDIHLTVDKTHACGGPSYECDVKINSVRNNLNGNIIELGKNHRFSSMLEDEDVEDMSYDLGIVKRLWVCCEQMRIDTKSGGMPISNWIISNPV